jgi:hypothetical protein
VACIATPAPYDGESPDDVTGVDGELARIAAVAAARFDIPTAIPKYNVAAAATVSKLDSSGGEQTLGPERQGTASASRSPLPRAAPHLAFPAGTIHGRAVAPVRQDDPGTTAEPNLLGLNGHINRFGALRGKLDCVVKREAGRREGNLLAYVER